MKENKDKINDFLQYDYVGAPWLRRKEVGNGGFSIRRKSKMLEIIHKCPYETLISDDIDYQNEDVYFSLLCPSVSINKPSYEESQIFSSETIWNPKSFGLHKVWHHKDLNIDMYPDIKLLYSLQDIEK